MILVTTQIPFVEGVQPMMVVEGSRILDVVSDGDSMELVYAHPEGDRGTVPDLVPWNLLVTEGEEPVDLSRLSYLATILRPAGRRLEATRRQTWFVFVVIYDNPPHKPPSDETPIEVDEP